MAENPACFKRSGGRLYLRYKKPKIYGDSDVLHNGAVHHLRRYTEICRTIYGGADSILSVSGIFCRVLYFRFYGNIPPYENPGTLGRYGTGGK